jgi:hypothetical protein
MQEELVSIFRMRVTPIIDRALSSTKEKRKIG